MRTGIGPAALGISLPTTSASGKGGAGKRPAPIIARNETASSSDQGGNGICAIMSIMALAFGSSGMRSVSSVMACLGGPLTSPIVCTDERRRSTVPVR